MSAYDKAENKKSAHESDSRKGHQAGSGTIRREEHVGGHGPNDGVKFKMPDGCVDHSVSHPKG